MNVPRIVGEHLSHHYVGPPGPPFHEGLNGTTAYHLARRQYEDALVRGRDPGRPLRAAGVGAVLALAAIAVWRLRGK